MTGLWGQDIALDVNLQAKVAANGELVLTENVETGVQDIRLRLMTYLGTLFYDLDYGSLIPDWFYEDSTPVTRDAFIAELIMRVEADPRVEFGSVSAAIIAWNEKSISATIDWKFIDEDQPMNLVLQYDKDIRQLIISVGRKNEPDGITLSDAEKRVWK